MLTKNWAGPLSNDVKNVLFFWISCKTDASQACIIWTGAGICISRSAFTNCRVLVHHYWPVEMLQLSKSVLVADFFCSLLDIMHRRLNRWRPLMEELCRRKHVMRAHMLKARTRTCIYNSLATQRMSLRVTHYRTHHKDAFTPCDNVLQF